MQREITYRLLKNADDLQQVVDIQRLIWGDDLAAHVPFHMLHSLAEAGSPLIGALDGDLLVGFSLGFFGMDVPHSDRPAMANLKIASKRLAVHPDYRNDGIGYRLKIEQYHFAMEKGVRLITWTFDPLLSRNAYLYIRKLGGIARRYYQDYYANSPGQVDRIDATDRFMCEWWITSNRVEERVHGSRRGLTVQDYLKGGTQIINPARFLPDGTVAVAESILALPDSALMLVEIPTDNRPLSNNPALASDWRHHTRQVFDLVLSAGYIVTDFIHQEYEGQQRSFYLMGFDGA